MKHSISEVIEEKGDQVCAVSAGDRVGEAVEVMVEHQVGSVVVLDARGLVMGVLSERDVMVDVVHVGADPWLTLVGDLIKGAPAVARPSESVREVLQRMTDRRTRHIPVVEDGALLGVVSIGDLTKWVTTDLRQSVTDLNSYISGPYVN